MPVRYSSRVFIRHPSPPATASTARLHDPGGIVFAQGVGAHRLPAADGHVGTVPAWPDGSAFLVCRHGIFKDGKQEPSGMFPGKFTAALQSALSELPAELRIVRQR